MISLEDIIRLMKEARKLGMEEVSIEWGDFRVEFRTSLSKPANIVEEEEQELQPEKETKPVAKPAEKAPEKPLPEPEELTVEEAEKRGMYIVRSPMVGTFYRRPQPDKPPFVKEGDRVKKGQVLALIEAMKIFNEIESEVDGVVVKILVEDASPVEFEQPLFIIDPNA